MELRKEYEAIIAAFLAKQREPETVKFRAARRIGVNHVELVRDLPDADWEWLEPAQEFEVKLS